MNSLPPLPSIKPKEIQVWGFDIESQPGPFAGRDFTYKNMLSIAGGYEGCERIGYLGPGFLPDELEEFVTPLREPGVLVVAHNGIRYDLPLLNGTMMKNGLLPLPRLMVHDTMSCLPKQGYAFSKGLGNMAHRFGIDQKGSMSEYDWEQAYAGDREALKKLRDYNINDVRVTFALRREQMRRGILGPPKAWKP